MANEETQQPGDAPIDDVSSLSDELDLSEMLKGLAQDLRDLRAGTISVREARARAELARQFFRGVHYVVLADKFLAGRALPAPKNDGEE